MISIIVPVYNTERYLPACIDSVRNQTYTDWELLLVDDGSSDSSGRICDQYAELDPRIRVVHKSNNGVSAARNTGIDAAKGEYLVFLDSDDEFAPDCIELLAEPLKKRDYDFVIGQVVIVGSDNYYPSLKLEDGAIEDNATILYHYAREAFYMMPWNKLCRVELIKQSNLYFKEGIHAEDDLWSFELVLAAHSMYAVNAAHYYYKINKNSYSERVQGRARILDDIPALKWMNRIAMDSKDHNHSDIILFFTWVYRSHYLMAITAGCEKEYRLLRKLDPRTSWDILRLCMSSGKRFRSNAHLLLPPFGGYRLYGFILKRFLS